MSLRRSVMNVLRCESDESRVNSGTGRENAKACCFNQAHSCPPGFIRDVARHAIRANWVPLRPSPSQNRKIVPGIWRSGCRMKAMILTFLIFPRLGGDELAGATAENFNEMNRC